MKSQENIDLEVTQDGLRFAGIYSLKITEKNERKRAFASLVILNSLTDFFMKQGLNASSTKSLYKASKFSEEFEITDLYVNNWRLDIRLATPDDYFYIPKSHYENEILPDFYVIATIDKELKKPQFIGYVSPKKLNKESYNSLYYRANFDDLGDMANFLQELKQEKHFYCKEKDHRFFHTKILSYFDNEADNFTKSKLLNHLLGCQNCRTELINFCGFDIIAQKLENFGDLFDDRSLNIIGALDAEDDEEEETGEDKNDSSEDSETETTQPNEEQDALIDGLFENTPKITKPITDSKPFKDISSDNIEVVLPVEDDKIALEEPTDIFLQDVPSLEEEKKEVQTDIKIDKEPPEERSVLTFTSDDTESPNKTQVSLAESLLDIPDEMFNTEYEEKNPKKSFTSNKKPISKSSKGEKVIIDYDEFGQPIYKENSPEDYKIVEEDQGDYFQKENGEQPDITDSFVKEGEQANVIEGSGETYNDELISNIPPQAKKKKKRVNYLLIVFGLFAIFLTAYFTQINPIFKNTETDVEIDKTLSDDPFGDSNLDDIIAKNINSKTGLVRIKNVNWIAQKDLLTDENFKEYLKKIDKRFKVKFKLNSNSFTKAPFNNNVIAEVIVTPDGIIKSKRIAAGSGIPNLDDAILTSLVEAMNNVPIPTLTQADMQLDEYYIKVMIKL